MKRLLVLTILLACSQTVGADEQYPDPNGLPSGTATLEWITQENIDAGADVYAFDFTTGTVDSLNTYDTVSDDGIADLVLLEIVSAPDEMYLGAPEGGASFDRFHIYGLGAGWALDEIGHIGDETGAPHELTNFEPAVNENAYLLMQVSELGDTTWVKFLVTEVTATDVTFDWVWQPNGDPTFIPPPPATQTGTLSLLKALFR